MERITFEGNFCDIAKCQEIMCPYGKDCSQKRVWERLKYYEDMEEQGRLKILPFAVGDTVYQIKRMTNAESKRAGVKPDYEGLYGGERNRVVFTPNRPYKIVKREATKSMVNGFGKTVFLTREEAEQALKGGASQ